MGDPISFAVATVAQIGISYLFPSEGPRLKDLKMSASTYGAAIPWVFGLTRVPGNMIWARDIREKKKKKMAGKGGAYNEYTYFCTFAMGLCQGPVKGILRIWADGKLVYDATGGTSLAVEGGNGYNGFVKQLLHDQLTNAAAPTLASKYRIRFYNGSEDQLPDSAMETTLGAGNAPAFRGMAYLLFDDVPLADFGNRIPQITAEVFVGDITQSVLVSPLLEAVDTPLAPYYVPGEAAFDWDRNYGYIRYDQEIAQINLRTFTQLQRFGRGNFSFPLNARLGKVLCVGGDSSVYVTWGESNADMPLARLDPYSMESVARTLTTYPVTQAVTAKDNTSIEYLLTCDNEGRLNLFQSNNLAHRWGSTFLGGSASAIIPRICGRDADTSALPTFYAAWGTSTALTLTKINGEAQTNVITLTGTSISLGAVLWDSAVPGVLIFWSDGASKYLSKWSEDTGQEVYRVSIAGFPDRMDPQARLQTSIYAWVAEDRLYIINTADGSFTDNSVDGGTGEINPNLGTIDWEDYLVRYPDVEQEYYNGGYEVASSPVEFAQWHYTHYGMAEGRTLTYVGGTLGGGYGLPDDYVGVDSFYQAFDPRRSALICLDGIDGIVRVNTASTGVSVGTVVERMLREGGLQDAQYDLSVLYSIALRGYGWASGTDIKSILDELRRLYLFDLVEREGVLVAVARADGDNGLGYSVETIPQNALGSSSEDATDFWQETRLQEADLPAKVTLAYMNWEQDYETSTARSQRLSNPVPTMFSRQTLAMELNVVMTPLEAKTQVSRILYSQWGERTKHTSRLPWSYLNLDAADIFSVHMNDSRTYSERLHLTEIGADFSIATESYGQDSGAYSDWDDLVADGGGTGRQTVSDDLKVALPFVLNTPLLRDQDNTGGSISLYYFGVGNGSNGTFTGATAFKSINTVDYDTMTTADSDVEWGTVIGTLGSPPVSPYALDWETRLTVLPAVDWFDMDSITDEQLWDGANAVIVGNEVLQFRDCVENADGTWTFWNLLRGRRGTEYACDNHSAGERFIFLANTTIATQAELINARGQARYFKAVGSGQTLQDTPVTQITYEPRDLMPYAPAAIMREFVTGDEVEVSWSRRTRLGGNMVDGTGEVPLSERTEAYEAYILAEPFSGDLSRGAPPAEYLRLYTVSVPFFTYTLQEQQEDGFDAATDDLNVVIYQLSDAVGRGFPGVRSITPNAWV